MTEHPDIKVLTTAATEPEAGIIVAMLRDDGIETQASGVLSSNLRTEAPGQVQILVQTDDLEQARKVLAEFRRGRDDIDWAQVDVGDPH